MRSKLIISKESKRKQDIPVMSLTPKLQVLRVNTDNSEASKMKNTIESGRNPSLAGKKTSKMVMVIPVLVIGLPVSVTALLSTITLTPAILTVLTLIITSLLIMATKYFIALITRITKQASATEWNVLSQDHPVLLINHLNEQNSQINK